MPGKFVGKIACGRICHSSTAGITYQPRAMLLRAIMLKFCCCELGFKLEQ